MKLLTWNINGIRSVKKDQTLKELFDSLNADIICLQETKITRDMLEEDLAIVEGYNAYYSFSKVRSGYSGVATYCKDNVTPSAAEDQIFLPSSYHEELSIDEIKDLNAEGRSVLTEHVYKQGRSLVVINLYCPRADLQNKERTEFKLKFYSLIEKKCRSLLEQQKEVIVVGDFNVSHKLIDHCNPDDPEIFDSNPSRKWASTFIWDPITDSEDVLTLQETNQSKKGTVKFIDAFRYFHPMQESSFTCWSTLTGARKTNYGTRIDYIFASSRIFENEFVDCVIRPDINGSDHCPVIATLRHEFISSLKPPLLCTKYMPEFAGKQQKLKHFFKPCDKIKEDTKVQQISTSNGNYDQSCVKMSKNLQEKRYLDASSFVQAKRLKTNKSGSKNLGNISSFFQKKCTKPKLADKLTNEQKAFDSKCDENHQHQRNQLEEVDIKECKSCESTPTCSQEHFECEDKPSLVNHKDTHNQSDVLRWRNILKGLPPPPLCTGHKEPSILRTVKNKGPNHGKKFYCCARPQGHSSNKDARCNYFMWMKK